MPTVSNPATVKKFLGRRVLNRMLSLLVRVCPGATTLRPCLHRWRGVKIGRNVFIGDDVYLDNEYPECIEIQDNVQISIRAIFVAHTRGPGRIVIEKNAFVGPNTVLICGGGRALRIGEGAAISAGCVITKSVPPHLFIASPAVKPTARVGVPLPCAESMEQFWAGLTPLPVPDKAAKPAPPPS